MPFSQYCSRPSRQLSHSRQESTMQPTPTRSPGAKSPTAAPTRLTRPTISWPGTSGYFCAPHSPRVACTSEWQSPQNSMAISTSSSFGARRATVSGTRPLSLAVAPYAAASRGLEPGADPGHGCGLRDRVPGWAWQGAAVRVVRESCSDATPAPSAVPIGAGLSGAGLRELPPSPPRSRGRWTIGKTIRDTAPPGSRRFPGQRFRALP